MNDNNFVPCCNACGTPMQDNNASGATFWCPSCQLSTLKPKDFNFDDFQQNTNQWNDNHWNNDNWNNNTDFSYWK